MNLAAPGPAKRAATGLFAKVWAMIGLPGRLILIGLVVLAVGWLAYAGLKRLGKRGRRSLLWGLTGIFMVGAAAFGYWVTQLPVEQRGVFVFWHQLVRVGAALSATGFVFTFMALALPWLLDRLGQRGFVNHVAVRHVRAGKSGFLTVISFLSIAGVGLSAFALCAAVSIMGGFGADLKRKILDNNAHMKIEVRASGGVDDWEPLLERVRLVKGVQAATPIVAGEAMASSTANRAGTLIRGVDPDTIGTVVALLDNIEVGKFEYLTSPAKLVDLPPDEVIGIGRGGQKYVRGPKVRRFGKDSIDPDVQRALEPVYPGIIVGRELAKTLRLRVADEVTLVSPLGDLGPMGVLPRTRRFRVAAIFYTGMYEYDSSHVYMKMEDAQEFLDMPGRVSALEIKVSDAERVDPVTERVRSVVKRKDMVVRDWKTLNKNLFSALKLEKIVTFMILTIAITVASYCIICTLLLMVTEKSKEIAILKALGASDGAVLRIFMVEGMIIGAIGTVFGVITGLVTVLGLLWFGVRLDPDVYYVERLPIAVEPLDYLLVAVSAMVITTLATIYPAWAASRLRPVDGIRYE